MRIGIVGIGVLALVLGACTPDERGSAAVTGATAQIPLPAHCFATPSFPRGSRVLGPAELGPQARMDPPMTEEDRVVVRWESVVFVIICHCREGTDMEAEMTKGTEASEFARQMAISVGGEAIANRIRTGAPSPGLETVALTANKAAIVRSRMMTQGKCMSIGAAAEANPVVRENREMTDRWFASWRFSDGRPVALTPLSDAWNQRRFD